MTNKPTKASKQTSAGTPRERAPQSQEKPTRTAEQPSPESNSKPDRAKIDRPTAASTINGKTASPTTPSEQGQADIKPHRTTQVVEGEHQKESAKRS